MNTEKKSLLLFLLVLIISAVFIHQTDADACADCAKCQQMREVIRSNTIMENMLGAAAKNECEKKVCVECFRIMM